MRGIQKMEPSVETATATAKDRHMPAMHRVGDLIAPKAPQDMATAGLEEGVLIDLAVRLAYTSARFSTEWVAKRLHLSLALSGEILDLMCRDGLAEEVLQTAQGRSHYRITQRG